MPAFVLLASCLELLGANLAIDTYALPIICAGDPSCGTYTMIGGPVEYAPGECYLPLPMADPYYDFMWCHGVTIAGANGPVEVSTPCLEDPNVVAAANAPYLARVYWAEKACPAGWIRDEGWCTVANVCTAQDKLNGDCTCTAAEQANDECTP